jgi:site-specific recombinase XerD
MPTSKLNLDEICKEYGISADVFLSLVKNKQSEKESLKIIDVIDMYLLQLLELVKTKKISTTTNKTYSNLLSRFKKYLINERPDILVDQLNDKLLMEFLGKGSKLGSNSSNTYISVFRSFLGFAYDQGIASKDFRRKLKANHDKHSLLPKCIPDVHIKDIIRECHHRVYGVRDNAIIHFMLQTGCRVSEVVNVRIIDLNLNENILYVRKHKNPNDRYISISPDLKYILLNYLEISGVRNINSSLTGFLFSKDFGINRTKPLSIRGLQDMFDTILTNLNLKGRYSLQSLRHTFAINSLKAGIDILNLQQILGHEDSKTTSIYIQALQFENLVNEVITHEETDDGTFES